MNWHYDNPVANGQYLCCVKGKSFPVYLNWYNGNWCNWEVDDFLPIDSIDQSLVVCYIGFDEIPMPENW